MAHQHRNAHSAPQDSDRRRSVLLALLAAIVLALLILAFAYGSAIRDPAR